MPSMNEHLYSFAETQSVTLQRPLRQEFGSFINRGTVVNDLVQSHDEFTGVLVLPNVSSHGNPRSTGVDGLFDEFEHFDI